MTVRHPPPGSCLECRALSAEWGYEAQISASLRGDSHVFLQPTPTTILFKLLSKFSTNKEPTHDAPRGIGAELYNIGENSVLTS